MVTMEKEDYAQENIELFAKYCSEECKITRKELENEIAELNIRLATVIAHKYSKGDTEQFDNFFSMASFGLVKAIRGFKNDKGIKFSTYAGMCMNNEILMSFRTNKKERSFDFISMDINLSFASNGSTSPLTEIIEDDRINIEDSYVNLELLRSIYEKAEKILNKRDMIIFQNYLLPKDERLTNRQMGSVLKISQSYVSRLQQSIMDRIKELLLTDWGQELWKN